MRFLQHMVQHCDMGLDFLQLPYFDIANAVLNIFYTNLNKSYNCCT